MFPMGPAPTNREGWVLAIADKLAALSDMADFVGGLFTGRSLVRRRRLRQEDPFFAQNAKPAVLVKSDEAHVSNLKGHIHPVAQAMQSLIPVREHRW